VRTREQVRMSRALEVLELIGSPAAREVLRMLASGVPEAHTTQEANWTVQRLAKRVGQGP